MFKAGLKLAATAQPAIRPLSQMALGLTKGIAARHRNVSVQDFYMGLDFQPHLDPCPPRRRPSWPSRSRKRWRRFGNGGRVVLQSG